MYESIYFSRGCTHKDILTFERSRCRHSTLNKLDVFDWLGDIHRRSHGPEMVEVRFKNTRKGFYLNSNQLNLQKGDMVAVEASPGMDIGIVSLTGELVKRQMLRNKVNPSIDFPKIFRKAKPPDIEKWKEAVESEIPTMFKAREVALGLGLNMKIGDVEFQGDRTKAIFYYTAEERVDFRQLIKSLADSFRIRIEMRQIGARQEAGQIGGIGSCGRELCCSSHLTSFSSVSTTAARHQDISPNPQKLTGQCGKLKCCLNYEVNTYIDAQQGFPDRKLVLETQQGPFFWFKSDIFRKIVWYSMEKENAVQVTALPLERVWEIIRLNQKGVQVPNLADKNYFEPSKPQFDFMNEVGNDSLTRFDDKRKPGKKNRKPGGGQDRPGSPRNEGKPARSGNAAAADVAPGQGGRPNQAPRPSAPSSPKQEGPVNSGVPETTQAKPPIAVEQERPRTPNAPQSGSLRSDSEIEKRKKKHWKPNRRNPDHPGSGHNQPAT